MRNKIWGGILTVMAIIGMASIAMHLTGKPWEIALFALFALLAADGVATVVADCLADYQGEEEE